MKARKLSSDDINELLTPLVDFNSMKHRSFWAIKNNFENLARDLKSSGKPVVLTYNGIIVGLLCDPCVYQKTEERRRRLEALLVGVPSKPTPNVGHVRMQSSDHQNIQNLKRCIAQIDRLEHEIMLHKCRLYDLEEQRQEISEKKPEKISTVGTISLVGRSKINKSLKT